MFTYAIDEDNVKNIKRLFVVENGQVCYTCAGFRGEMQGSEKVVINLRTPLFEYAGAIWFERIVDDRDKLLIVICLNGETIRCCHDMNEKLKMLKEKIKKIQKEKAIKLKDNINEIVNPVNKSFLSTDSDGLSQSFESTAYDEILKEVVPITPLLSIRRSGYSRIL